MRESETLLAAVRTRVHRASEGNLAAVVDSEALHEARSLAASLPDDLEAEHALGWLYYFRVAAVYPAPVEEDLAAAIKYFSKPFLVGMANIPHSLLSSLAVSVAPTSVDAIVRLAAQRDPADLTLAVDTSRRIARNLPEGHRLLRGVYLIILGGVLDARFELTGDLRDADEAVDAYRDAVQATPDDHPHREAPLIKLCSALLKRFERTQDLRDLDESVDVGRAAVRATPDHHPDRGASLINLNCALLKRFEHTGDLRDVTEGADVGRAAVRATPDEHPHREAVLANIGAAMWLRFERTGRLQDLDEAVEASRAAVQITPDDHPERIDRVGSLATALQARFERTGDLGDLDEVVEAYRDAARVTPDHHRDRGALLTNLGLALQTRAERTGDLADLDEAVDLGRDAVRATPNDHPGHPMYLSNLGIAMEQRYRRTGDLRDLDEAVDVSRAAVRATPDEHPQRSAPLTTLGSALQARFERTGDLGDLDEAVEASRDAVRATPHSDSDRGMNLSSLGVALRSRFERTKDLEDLGEAVDMGRSAVRATPNDHPNRAIYLDTLGSALWVWFQHTRDVGVLDDAVEAYRSAVGATPEDHLNRPLSLSNLGIALWSRFERTGDLVDLGEAVDVGRSAVRATSDDHPNCAAYLANLGSALRSRFERTRDLEDRDEALSVWERIVGLRAAAPWLRVRAARAGADLAASSDLGRAAGLLERAVLMLPEVAPRRLQRGDQQYALGRDAEGLAADAIALALADTSVDAQARAVRALRLAEAGRTVLTSQILDTRSDLTDLYEQHPALAERFTELRELLDQDLSATATSTGVNGPGGPVLERHRLAAELEELLGRVRDCEGFAAFGLPPAFDDLLAETAYGPVVTFNVSSYRSDALLLTRDGATSCSLPQLTMDAVRRQINRFYQALGETTAPDGDRIAAQQTLRQVLEWLWQAAAEPVLSALVDLGVGIPPAHGGEPLPRVWWAPGGLLGLLPLHAAGFHTDPERGPHRRTLLDRVVSSYTPTIRALRHARHHQRQSTDATRSLIVTMPTTPGLSPLRHAPEEARRVRALLPGPLQLTEPALAPNDNGLPPSVDTPTTATVLAHLPQCAIAHFACHGTSDLTDPSQSQLLLHDHATTALTVSALVQVNLERAQLAYLSACSTADPGSPDLLDEAIHLTSAFQLAGFPHVVGTLWAIDDGIAVEIAESFYTHLTTGPSGTLDTDQAASALHHTIRAVRDRYPATPSLWAAYLHSGA